MPLTKKGKTSTPKFNIEMLQITLSVNGVAVAHAQANPRYLTDVAFAREVGASLGELSIQIVDQLKVELKNDNANALSFDLQLAGSGRAN